MEACLGGEGSRDEDGLAWDGRFGADVLHQARHLLPKLRRHQLVHLPIFAK